MDVQYINPNTPAPIAVKQFLGGLTFTAAEKKLVREVSQRIIDIEKIKEAYPRKGEEGRREAERLAAENPSAETAKAVHDAIVHDYFTGRTWERLGVVFAPTIDKEINRLIPVATGALDKLVELITEAAKSHREHVEASKFDADISLFEDRLNRTFEGLAHDRGEIMRNSKALEWLCDHDLFPNPYDAVALDVTLDELE